MGRIPTKQVNHDFFKTWGRNMAYILGYTVADGCIYKQKDRKNGYYFNITSKDKDHLVKLNKALESTFSICKKYSSNKSLAYQFSIRSKDIFDDLLKLGIKRRKTYDFNYRINTPSEYFSDFVRGFFDGDGSVYIYIVNGTPQIKASFISTNHSFITELNRKICKNLHIPSKNIHKENYKGKITQYSIDFYINDCEKLAKFMYKNNPLLYLHRKYKIFQKWNSINRRGYNKVNYPSKVGWQLNQKFFANK